MASPRWNSPPLQLSTTYFAVSSPASMPAAPFLPPLAVIPLARTWCSSARRAQPPTRTDTKAVRRTLSTADLFPRTSAEATYLVTLAGTQRQVPLSGARVTIRVPGTYGPGTRRRAAAGAPCVEAHALLVKWQQGHTRGCVCFRRARGGTSARHDFVHARDHGRRAVSRNISCADAILPPQHLDKVLFPLLRLGLHARPLELGEKGSFIRENDSKFRNPTYFSVNLCIKVIQRLAENQVGRIRNRFPKLRSCQLSSKSSV